MTKNRIILILGVFIAILPILGFPTSWRSFFMTVFGIAIVILALLNAREKRSKSIVKNRRKKIETVREMYAESSPGPLKYHKHVSEGSFPMNLNSVNPDEVDVDTDEDDDDNKDTLQNGNTEKV